MLKKEPDNKYDHEAIQVKVPGLGVIGYVANSVQTVLGESYSAGRLYDKIDDEAEAGHLLVFEKRNMKNGFFCKKSQNNYCIIMREHL